MKNQIKSHQGDVQMITISSLPAGAKQIEKKPIALGEHSGHQHVITGDYEMFEDSEGNLFAAIGNDGAFLQHIHESNFKGFKMPLTEKADHRPLVKSLQSGTIIQFGIHKKYNPFAGVWERSKD
jgi:hypothetical protein